jgi:hypothetical protein
MLFEKGKCEMTDTTNVTSARYADANAAFAAIEAAGLNKADYRAVPDQGEYILILRADPFRAEPAKVAKGKAEKAAPKAGAKAKAETPKKGGRLSVQAKQDKERADAEKAKAEKAKAKADKPDFSGPWHKLDDRKWIGAWADQRAKAEKGQLPDAMGEKTFDCRKAFGGIFLAATHHPFDKRIAKLAELIRAKDLKGLKDHKVNEISTTPIMLGKLRDLAIAALTAKAEKPAKKGKAEKAEAPAPAPEAPQA